jgi:predicted small lipoprotein YifL
MKSFLKLVAASFAVFTLVGCGLKGPLYFPADQSNASIQSNDINKIA